MLRRIIACLTVLGSGCTFLVPGVTPGDGGDNGLNDFIAADDPVLPVTDDSLSAADFTGVTLDLVAPADDSGLSPLDLLGVDLIVPPGVDLTAPPPPDMTSTDQAFTPNPDCMCLIQIDLTAPPPDLTLRLPDFTLAADVMTFSAPVITDIQPRQGTSSGNTTLTIAGNNFRMGATVSVAGTLVANPIVDGSGTKIMIITPARSNAFGPAMIVVTNPDKQSAGSNLFSYYLGTVGLGTAIPFGDGVVGNSGTSGVAAADLNGDGKLDLASTNYNHDKLSILEGKGDGTFKSAVTYGTGGGTSPQSLVIADFNKDGNPDVATANYSKKNVSVLLNLAKGTFPMVSSTIDIGLANVNPISIAAADFNGDSLPDLATGSGGTNAGGVSVATGNADGSFNKLNPTSGGYAVYGVRAADFNGDMKLDLALANNSDASLHVLTGKGDGTFGTDTKIALADKPYAVTVADFNGDGKPDIAAVIYNTPPNNVAVLINNGAGFAAPVYYSAGDHPASLVPIDLNLDGAFDLAVANRLENKVTVFINKNDKTGTLTNPTSYGAGGTSPAGIAAGDFNGDGKPDLATANYGSGNVGVLLNTSQ